MARLQGYRCIPVVEQTRVTMRLRTLRLITWTPSKPSTG